MSDTTQELEGIARKIRQGAISSIYHARSGHPGGSLSIAEMLAVLYFDVMQVDPQQPGDLDRDRFILSKGHACPALYAALALKGYFAWDELKGLRHTEHFLEGHPDVKTPGIDAPSGSLGMGLSQGLGMALGARCSKRSFRTYVILGDGDMQEGNTWEAFMLAAHLKVASLTAIVDGNERQGEDTVAAQLEYRPARQKLEAFGWHCQEVDGHDVAALQAALKAAREEAERPSVIIARTVKGKGVDYMEDVQVWHGSSTLSDDEHAAAQKALEASE